MSKKLSDVIQDLTRPVFNIEKAKKVFGEKKPKPVLVEVGSHFVDYERPLTSAERMMALVNSIDLSVHIPTQPSYKQAKELIDACINEQMYELDYTMDTPTRENAKPKFYPFWELEDNAESVLRFLPDKNQNNGMEFVLERLIHRVPVINTKSEAKSALGTTYPCLHQYGGVECPICAASKYYFQKGTNDKLAKQLWRQKQYIAQVIVVKDGIKYDDPDESAEGQVRIVVLSPTIFKSIKNSIIGGYETRSGDWYEDENPLQAVPSDFEEGRDFVLKKRMTGSGWPDYSRKLEYQEPPEEKLGW